MRTNFIISVSEKLSIIARANEKRDWRIFQDFGLNLIEQARILYESDNQLDTKLKGTVFALDSTTVDLCLEVFLWATFRSTKSAIKIHTTTWSLVIALA